MEKHNCKKCINVCDCCAFKNSRYRCIKCVPCGEKFIPRGTVKTCPKDLSIINFNKTPLLKIGDVVRVRKDLKVANCQDYETYYMLTTGMHDGVSSNMSMFFGKEVTIGRASLYGYSLREDIEGWNWTDEMFELEDYERD